MSLTWWTACKLLGAIGFFAGLIWLRRHLIEYPRLYRHERTVLARRTWRKWE